jgi:hypothetical protein
LHFTKLSEGGNTKDVGMIGFKNMNMQQQILQSVVQGVVG